MSTYSLLVIGETGCGKSTLINTLCNYFLDGSVNKLKVAITTKFLKATENFKSNENDSGDRTKSQTDSCNNYQFKKDGKNFIFIDTPGLSDSRGIKQDDINLGKIIDAAENASSLSAIVIIINGTVARITINLKNVIARLRGSIPDSLLNNVFIIFTNCLKHTRNFDVNSLEIEVKPEHIFHMNNTAFSTDPKLWDETSTESIQTEFALSFKTITKLIETVIKLDNVSTKDFTEMKKHRFDIKAILHKAKLDIINLQKLQDAISIHQAQLDKANKDKESFKNFTKTNLITSNELVTAPYHSTICSECNFVCHERCGLSEISNKGDNAFVSCAAMSGTNNCINCPHKCSYKLHYHDKKTMKQVTKTVEEELKELKEKYLLSDKNSKDAANHINSVQSAKKLMDEALKKMTNDIVGSCAALKKLCSGFNLVDELFITLQQMEMESKQHTSNDARKTAEEMIRVIREIADKLNQESALKKKKDFKKIDESKITSTTTTTTTTSSSSSSSSKKGENNKSTSEENVSFKCQDCKKESKMKKSIIDSLKKSKSPLRCYNCYKKSQETRDSGKTTKTSDNNHGSDEDVGSTKTSPDSSKQQEKVEKVCSNCKDKYFIKKEKIVKLKKTGNYKSICRKCLFKPVTKS